MEFGLRTSNITSPLCQVAKYVKGLWAEEGWLEGQFDVFRLASFYVILPNLSGLMWSEIYRGEWLYWNSRAFRKSETEFE